MIIDRTPLGRIGQPNDIGDVVAFLCSEDGRWVSGQTISVDGGVSGQTISVDGGLV